jgi:uncharacterized protein YcbK (DUF882 family)
MQHRHTGRPRVGVVRDGLALAVCLIALVGVGVNATAAAASLPTGGAVAKRPPVSTRAPARKGTPRGPAPAVMLYHVNHRETMRLRFADERGRPIKGFQRQFDRFLRCHYTNKQHAMNPRLARLLYETGRNYPGRRIEVVSGYRHPKFAKNPHSPHKQGLACDVRVPGVKNTELRDFFRARFKSVGVGYYPNSSFVHLDVRRGSSAFWIDYSGPGETALYSKNALEDLRSGRAERWRLTTIDPAWADSPDEEESPEGGQSEGGQSEIEPNEDGADSGGSQGE